MGSLLCRTTLPWLNKQVSSVVRRRIKLQILSVSWYNHTVVALNNLPFYVSARHCVGQVHVISTDEKMTTTYYNTIRVEASVYVFCLT